MDASIRAIVRKRAQAACEYCHIPEVAFRLSFHVEHVLPLQHGGTDDLENLAWACPKCNVFKGTNLATIDPATQQQVQVYNPRTEAWDTHFEIDQYVIVGLTGIGRGTVRLLQMNTDLRVAVREKYL